MLNMSHLLSYHAAIVSYPCDYRSFHNNLQVTQLGPEITDEDTSLAAEGALNGKPWLLGGFNVQVGHSLTEYYYFIL
jgi:hypothetical protein